MSTGGPEELDDYVAAFERAGPGADIAAFLPPADHPLYRDVLCELVRVDLELSWRGGRPRPAEEYLRRFPALLADPRCVRAVAYEERRLRQMTGPRGGCRRPPPPAPAEGDGGTAPGG